jgi:hypothetical protein
MESLLICVVCFKRFSTIQGLNGHVQRSHLQLSRQSEYGKLGKEKIVKARLEGRGFFNHSEKTKNLLSIRACERLSKHSKYTRNVEYKPGVILESSYEVRTAEILDKLNIKWERVRKGYIWNDNGKKRRYIPDFYLPEHDSFLDPKNDYLIKKDERKIKSAMTLNKIKVIVLSNLEINESKIKQLLL